MKILNITAVSIEDSQSFGVQDIYQALFFSHRLSFLDDPEVRICLPIRDGSSRNSSVLQQKRLGIQSGHGEIM